MRSLLAAAALLTLVACDEARSTPSEGPGAEPGILTGQYRAMSDTARVVTGDVSIERGGLLFDRGVVLYTRTLEPRRGEDRIARDGDTYAAVAVGPSDLTIELRRVGEQALTGGAHGLCGGERPSYVALAYQQRATSVTLMVFSGAEAPGPDATQSQLCATYAYSAPDGARTSQGVVLR